MKFSNITIARYEIATVMAYDITKDAHSPLRNKAKPEIVIPVFSPTALIKPSIVVAIIKSNSLTFKPELASCSKDSTMLFVIHRWVSSHQKKPPIMN